MSSPANAMTLHLFAFGLLRSIAAARPMYLAIWCALAALSVVLLVSMRSRWGRSRPLYRCAALSLVVHLVLAGLAMTVRLMVGDGGSGVGPPIRVRVVDEVAETGSLEVDAPPLLVNAETEPANDVATPAEAPEPPPLLDPPEPIAEASPVDDTPLVVDAEPEPPTTEPLPQPTVTEASIATDATPAEPAAADQTIVPATSPYALRNAADRLHWAEQQGGSQQTEAAVAAALAWLAKTQSPDGRWDASQFGAGVERSVLGQDRGGAGADADTGISALAILAFLGAGHSHYEGQYTTTVRNGLQFLAAGQRADGNLAPNVGLYAQMYCHSMSTFALAEVLAMTGDKRLEPTVRRAVNYCLRAQHPSTGGWRYRVGDTGDTSQMGWQLMALWSAQRAGVEIPSQSWTGAERFLRSVRRGRYGGLASYRPDGPASTPMTAEAMYCRQLVTESIGGGTDRLTTAEATAQLLATLPDASRVNLYYWYYGTLALHSQQQTNAESLHAWHTWNSALTTALLQTQRADGAEAGSWDPICIWGGYGGRVYSTALATLCLEVYYRYAPLANQNGWTASRPDGGTARE